MCDNNKLKPCPFCGGEAYVFEPNYPEEMGLRYGVTCVKCKVNTSTIYRKRLHAINAWNNRVKEENCE